MSANLEKKIGHVPPKAIPDPFAAFDASLAAEVAPTYADHKTAAVGFFEHHAGDLFTLNPGIPADVVLEQASALLESVIDTMARCCMDSEGTDSTLWTAIYVSKMAKAMVDGVINGRAIGGAA